MCVAASRQLPTQLARYLSISHCQIHVRARHSTRVCCFPAPEAARRTLIASTQTEGQADSALGRREGNGLILQRIDDSRRDPSLNCRHEQPHDLAPSVRPYDDARKPESRGGERRSQIVAQPVIRLRVLLSPL